jgi:hypothetical protein
MLRDEAIEGLLDRLEELTRGRFRILVEHGRYFVALSDGSAGDVALGGWNRNLSDALVEAAQALERTT